MIYKMSTTIYILKLVKGKYYVGKTSNFVKRYQEHVSGTGAVWTRLYKPVAVVKTIPGASPFDEDRYTKEFMAKYGIDNVRGGSYASHELSYLQEEALKREIWGATDSCNRCGRKGHFASSCYAKSDVAGNSLGESESEEEVVHVKTKGTCYRCGRSGHYSPDCYAARHVKGYELD
jgi:cellular nucleic acid-binding protein